MKPNLMLILVLVLLALSGGIAWQLWPRDDAQPPAPKPAQAKIEVKAAPEVAVVELPKIAPAKPSESPAAASVPPAPNSANTAKRLAQRDQLRQNLERQTPTLLGQIQDRINRATNDHERQMYTKQLATMQYELQARIEQLALPPPPPVYLGEVALVNGTPVTTKIYDGVITVTPRLNGQGKWEATVNVNYFFPWGGGTNSGTVIMVTSGQPIIVNLSDNEIHFTPRDGSGASSTPTPASALPEIEAYTGSITFTGSSMILNGPPPPRPPPAR
jgi:hypothetical protein